MRICPTSSQSVIILLVLSRDSSVILLALSCNDSNSLSWGPSSAAAAPAAIFRSIQSARISKKLKPESRTNSSFFCAFGYNCSVLHSSLCFQPRERRTQLPSEKRTRGRGWYIFQRQGLNPLFLTFSKVAKLGFFKYFKVDGFFTFWDKLTPPFFRSVLRTGVMIVINFCVLVLAKQD